MRIVLFNLAFAVSSLLSVAGIAWGFWGLAVVRSGGVAKQVGHTVSLMLGCIAMLIAARILFLVANGRV